MYVLVVVSFKQKGNTMKLFGLWIMTMKQRNKDLRTLDEYHQKVQTLIKEHKAQESLSSKEIALLFNRLDKANAENKRITSCAIAC